jgi:hypothetical protein
MLALGLSLLSSFLTFLSLSSLPLFSYSSENLFFWLDVENYTNIPGSDFRKRTAVKMCKKYIDDNVSDLTSILILFD